ncbi:LysM peptidoglycan-binding domain-containing protein [Flavobacterium crassostreae]|uniref:Lytic transglycosylase n=1 Tax=Flavobacterium crassostreae TaxID=1763534 RepID=A0A1B9E0I7_9FLAO|nr:LysM peptidoglycan-binding domain-containing protein [Flavobacterium crassostreae]OCB75441.1 lytic transglycosylase [Flavobacterium crassostreae]
MFLKNTTCALLLLISAPVFSQQRTVPKDIFKHASSLSYLDSIKSTFVKDEIALCVDSLWMTELNNLDLFEELTADIQNIDFDKKVAYDLPTSVLKSRLKAMNAKSPFRIEYHPSLENIIKAYLKYRKKSFGKLMGLSQYYFPIFEAAFAKENVPLEIKYLAIVESALNPKAVSRMGATGLWQFMYQTGKQYDLHIDSYIDERSDPLKATAAAAKYMSRMHGIFGDWELVLASYNSGPGNVSKAIRRSGGKQNYWNIRKKLPKETQGYVPAFLATMYLYEYHKEHGIVPEEAIIPHFATDTVRIRQQLSFQQISNLLDVSVPQLQALNPSYKLEVIPVYEQDDHYLRLPKSKIAVFVSNEEKIYAYANHQEKLKEQPRSQVAKATPTIDRQSRNLAARYHTIRSGDNLGAIARKYHVSVANLKKWNALRTNTITAGRKLRVSQRASVAANKSYSVKKGDSLYSIAKKYSGVSIVDLKKWNGIRGEAIKPGMKLRIKR